MRLGTVVTPDGGLRAVGLRDGELVELAEPIAALLTQGPRAISRAIDASKVSHSLQQSRLGPAAGRPAKIVCVGRNYAEHAQETGHAVSERPEVFLRTATSLTGPYDDVVRPAASEQMDYEVELAVVIGRGGRNIDVTDAAAHIAGYCVFNDLSIRDFQFAGSQWTAGKNFDRTGPLGPFIVTADEIDDPYGLELTTTVTGSDGRGEVLQRSNTSLMVHRIEEVIAYVSIFSALEPGDVIATGTPSGVGMARSPQRWLVPGETVTCAVEKIGEIKNRVVSETSHSA